MVGAGAGKTLLYFHEKAGLVQYWLNKRRAGIPLSLQYFYVQKNVLKQKGKQITDNEDTILKQRPKSLQNQS